MLFSAVIGLLRRSFLHYAMTNKFPKAEVSDTTSDATKTQKLNQKNYRIVYLLLVLSISGTCASSNDNLFTFLFAVKETVSVFEFFHTSIVRCIFCMLPSAQ